MEEKTRAIVATLQTARQAFIQSSRPMKLHAGNRLRYAVGRGDYDTLSNDERLQLAWIVVALVPDATDDELFFATGIETKVLARARALPVAWYPTHPLGSDVMPLWNPEPTSCTVRPSGRAEVHLVQLSDEGAGEFADRVRRELLRLLQLLRLLGE